MAIEASGLVGALEAMWRAIQARHPEVPAVVVTLGAGTIGVPAGAVKLGHFAPHRWAAPGDDAAVCELFVGGEGLNSGAESVLETLLHEGAHGLAHGRRIQDTSRQGRYHNAKFKALGEEVGLTITQTAPIGWSGTELAPGTAEEYGTELQQLASAITAYRYSETDALAMPTGADESGDDVDEDQSAAGGRRRPKNGLVLVCQCRRRIRASVAVVEVGPILCGVCGEAFDESA